MAILSAELLLISIPGKFSSMVDFLNKPSDLA